MPVATAAPAIMRRVFFDFKNFFADFNGNTRSFRANGSVFGEKIKRAALVN